MKKEDAIKLLGNGKKSKVAKLIGYKTPMAVHMWPDVLPPAVEDRVLAAWIRVNVPAIIPKEFTNAMQVDI